MIGPSLQLCDVYTHDENQRKVVAGGVACPLPLSAVARWGKRPSSNFPQSNQWLKAGLSIAEGSEAQRRLADGPGEETGSHALLQLVRKQGQGFGSSKYQTCMKCMQNGGTV